MKNKRKRNPNSVTNNEVVWAKENYEWELLEKL